MQTPRRTTRVRLKQVLAYALYCGAAVYVLVELSFSTLYATGLISLPPTVYVIEDTGGTVQFDPISGYRLARTPSRQAQVTFGELEYIGVLRGNNQGFADRDDFGPQRNKPGCRRLAVFGDSFTAAQYLAMNWPDKLEDIAEQEGVCIELPNFAIDGGGLANWWSILTRLIAPEEYQLDGIIFAVYADDLVRDFYIAEHRGYQQHTFNYIPSWDPETWPKTLEEARPLLDHRYGNILPPDTFDQAIKGKWRPAQPPRPWRPYVALKAASLLSAIADRLKSALSVDAVSAAVLPPDDLFAPGQQRFIEEIAGYARARSIPVLVVAVPDRGPLLFNAATKRPLGETGFVRQDIIAFAERLSADFVDGSEPFVGLDQDAIRAHWLPYDTHWGQAGSDRFAAFMFDVIQEWGQTRVREDAQE